MTKDTTPAENSLARVNCDRGNVGCFKFFQALVDERLATLVLEKLKKAGVHG